MYHPIILTVYNFICYFADKDFSYKKSLSKKNEWILFNYPTLWLKLTQQQQKFNQQPFK